MFNNIKNSPNYHWYVLAVVFIGTFMATLDSSIVNVALPTISGNMHSSLSILQWIVTAYLLTITSLLLPFGSISDRFGRKKVYSFGFLIFILGSALCGFAQNIWFLITARVLQATGASMLMANSSAIITAIFPPKERGKALGLIGTVVALGSLTGPALGGILIGLAGWRSIFFINLPVGIIGYLSSLMVLPKDLLHKDHGSFDYKGALLFTAGMVSLLFAVNNGIDLGWTSLPILFGLAIGGVLIAAFIITELKIEHPMIDLSLFLNRPFLIGNITGWLCFTAMFANVIILPFYLQHILNYTPTQVGLMMTVFPIIMAFVAPLSGHLSDKFGPKLLTTGGLIISALGLFYYSTLTSASLFYQILPAPLLAGLGSGMFQSPNNSSVMGSVPTRKLGVAGSVNSLVRNLGMTTGIAYSVSLFVALGGSTSPNPGQTDVFMSAYHFVMLSAMAVALAAAVISINRKNAIHAENPANPVPMREATRD